MISFKVNYKIYKVKIIAYSGFSGIDIAEKVIRAGANNFIAKPFRRQEIINVVNDLYVENNVKHSMAM